MSDVAASAAVAPPAKGAATAAAPAASTPLQTAAVTPIVSAQHTEPHTAHATRRTHAARCRDPLVHSAPASMQRAAQPERPWADGSVRVLLSQLSPSSPSLSSLESTRSLSSAGAPGEFATPTAAPTLQGALWKKGSTFGGWTQRHYRFHPELSRIFYSKGEEGAIRGEIVLLKFTVQDLAATAPNASAAASLAGQFRIECPNRVHVLRCDDVKQLPAWVAALSALSRANSAKRKDSIIRETVDAVANSPNPTAVASHCASCKEAFGILRSKHLCAKCALVFCGSLQCMEAKSLHSSTGRCCISCAASRDANAPQATAKKGLVSSFMGALGSPFNPKLKPSNANLLIRVMAGRHLMVCDASGFSDPYCCIFFDGQEYRTEIEFQTLNPVWNAQFNIPITGLSKDIQIGVYDSDRYSNDDFMGMVQIPLSELENDKVFEDWFPLKGRPGKRADKTLAISGAIHLQLVVTESLFSLFAPIWEHQLQPEEKYSQVVLKHNIKRVTNIVDSIQIAWWQQSIEEVLMYKRPVQSILWLLAIQATVLFYPAEWILPAIPLLLLMALCANFISDQSRLIEELESRSVFSSALMQATDASGMKKASDAVQQAALMNIPEGGALVKSNSNNGSNGQSGSNNKGGDNDKDSNGSNGAGGTADPDDDEEDEEEEEVDEKRMALGFLGKIRQYQKQLAKVQHLIGKVCDKVEAVQNLFRWHDARRSKMVAIVLLVAFVFLLIVPFRLLLFLGVTARWAKRLLTALKKKRPKPKKPSEVENFLARTQTTISLNPLKMHLVDKLRKS